MKNSSTSLPFFKMHGLGNDCVIFDGRNSPVSLSKEEIRTISDRRHGIGGDQVVILQQSQTGADVMMSIFNADGTRVNACGNATRCVGLLLMQEQNKTSVSIETPHDILIAEFDEDQNIKVDMGPVQMAWQDIPLSQEVDTLHVPLNVGVLRDPVAIGIGNPHLIYIISADMEVDVAHYGELASDHSLLPEGANVGVVIVTSPHQIYLRTWERGVGVTPACGSNACAAVVATACRKLTERRVKVDLDGGSLYVEWLPNNHVTQTGAAKLVYSGFYKI